jgi:hypothetical protein
MWEYAYTGLNEAGLAQMGFGLYVYRWRVNSLKHIRTAVSRMNNKFPIFGSGSRGEGIKFEQAIVLIVAHHDPVQQLVIGEEFMQEANDEMTVKVRDPEPGDIRNVQLDNSDFGASSSAPSAAVPTVQSQPAAASSTSGGSPPPLESAIRPLESVARPPWSWASGSGIDVASLPDSEVSALAGFTHRRLVTPPSRFVPGERDSRSKVAEPPVGISPAVAAKLAAASSRQKKKSTKKETSTVAVKEYADSDDETCVSCLRPLPDKAEKMPAAYLSWPELGTAIQPLMASLTQHLGSEEHVNIVICTCEARYLGLQSFAAAVGMAGPGSSTPSTCGAIISSLRPTITDTFKTWFSLALQKYMKANMEVSFRLQGRVHVRPVRPGLVQCLASALSEPMVDSMRPFYVQSKSRLVPGGLTREVIRESADVAFYTDMLSHPVARTIHSPELDSSDVDVAMPARASPPIGLTRGASAPPTSLVAAYPGRRMYVLNHAKFDAEMVKLVLTDAEKEMIRAEKDRSKALTGAAASASCQQCAQVDRVALAEAAKTMDFTTVEIDPTYPLASRAWVTQANQERQSRLKMTKNVRIATAIGVEQRTIQIGEEIIAKCRASNHLVEVAIAQYNLRDYIKSLEELKRSYRAGYSAAPISRSVPSSPTAPASSPSRASSVPTRNSSSPSTPMSVSPAVVSSGTPIREGPSPPSASPLPSPGSSPAQSPAPMQGVTSFLDSELDDDAFCALVDSTEQAIPPGVGTTVAPSSSVPVTESDEKVVGDPSVSESQAPMDVVDMLDSDLEEASDAELDSPGDDERKSASGRVSSKRRGTRRAGTKHRKKRKTEKSLSDNAPEQSTGTSPTGATSAIES